jgi:hypothetical protein
MVIVATVAATKDSASPSRGLLQFAGIFHAAVGPTCPVLLQQERCLCIFCHGLGRFLAYTVRSQHRDYPIWCAAAEVVHVTSLGVAAMPPGESVGSSCLLRREILEEQIVSKPACVATSTYQHRRPPSLGRLRALAAPVSDRFWKPNEHRKSALFRPFRLARTLTGSVRGQLTQAFILRAARTRLMPRA